MQNFISKFFFFLHFPIVIDSLYEAINSQMNFMNPVDVPKPNLQVKES